MTPMSSNHASGDRPLREILFDMMVRGQPFNPYEDLVRWDTALVGFVLLVGLWLVFRRRLPGWAALGMFMVAGTFGDGMLPEQTMSWLWSFAWDRMSWANTHTQRFVLVLAVAAVLGAMCAFRRTRTPERVIWTLVSGSVFATSCLFHVLFIHGIMMTDLMVRADELKAVAARATDAEFDGFCRTTGVWCERGEHKGAVGAPPGAVEIREDLDKEDRKHRRSARAQNGAPAYEWTYLTGNSQRLGPYAAHMRRGEHGYRLMVDTKGVKGVYDASDFVFRVQMALTHTVWVFGGIALLLFHGARLPRRRAEAGEGVR